MYDMHFDLLSVLYYLKHNNEKKFNEFKKIFQKIYTNNIAGGIINLYFMPEKDMISELDISHDIYSNLIKYFSESIILYREITKSLNIYPNHIFGIEGCDCINNTNDLEHLYKLGLRSIILVWNYENKYASGVKSDGDLTKEGQNLISKAIDLNMIIDLSHMNELSFNSTIKYILNKHSEYNKLIVSHSNVSSINSHIRNLSDEQLLLLKKVNGKIGLTTYMPFIGKNKTILDHINYLIDNLEYSFDDIFISSDEMIYIDSEYYKDTNICNLINYKETLYNTLLNEYGQKETIKILKNNGKKIVNEVK